MFGVGELEIVLVEKDILLDPLILHLESLSNLLSFHFHQNSILIIYNLGKSSSWSICARVFTQSCEHLCGSVGLCLLQTSILSHLFWTSECFYYPSLVPTFLRVILSISTLSFMLITSAIICCSTFKWTQMVSNFTIWLFFFFLLLFHVFLISHFHSSFSSCLLDSCLPIIILSTFCYSSFLFFYA